MRVFWLIGRRDDVNVRWRRRGVFRRKSPSNDPSPLHDAPLEALNAARSHPPTMASMIRIAPIARPVARHARSTRRAPRKVRHPPPRRARAPYIHFHLAPNVQPSGALYAQDGRPFRAARLESVALTRPFAVPADHREGVRPRRGARSTECLPLTNPFRPLLSIGIGTLSRAIRRSASFLSSTFRQPS